MFHVQFGLHRVPVGCSLMEHGLRSRQIELAKRLRVLKASCRKPLAPFKSTRAVALPVNRERYLLKLLASFLHPRAQPASPAFMFGKRAGIISTQVGAVER